MDTDSSKDRDLTLADLLDVDKLGSDSEDSTNGVATSPHRPFKRLHIHVDMSTQYLTPGPHHADRDSTSCSSGPSTGAYTTPELDPYSAVRADEAACRPPFATFTNIYLPPQQVSGVSSFNYPAAADSTLLTPVSSAGSPPLQQRQATKTMRNYHQTQNGPAVTQAPTPPNTSKLYYSSYGIDSSSQGSSPMTVQVTEAAHFDMAPYMAHSPPGGHHAPSPKAEVPPPIDPYLGHFTVSGGSEPEVSHHPFQEHYQFASVDIDPTAQFLTRQQQHVPVSAPHMHHRMSSNGVPAPIMTQQYRPQSIPRIGGIEDLRGDPSMLLGPYSPHPSLSPGRRPVPPPRKSKAPTKKGSRNTPKTTPHIGSGEGQGGLDGEEREELTLRDDAPEDDKYLFQLRKEFISEKGKGMWEEMKAKYSEKNQGNWEKAALQMKVSRAVAKYGVWPKKEVSPPGPIHLARTRTNHFCLLDRASQGSPPVLRREAIPAYPRPHEGQRRVSRLGLEAAAR